MRTHPPPILSAGRPAFLLAVSLAITLAGAPARAGNEPEKGQRRTQEDIVPKVAQACGLALSIVYDGDSLRQNNKDVGYDQTDGASECNEPLRYLWYACQNAPGKAAVKAARISKVVCKGVGGGTGSLALAAGTITVGRAFEEAHPFLRSRKQFEALIKTTLKLASDDPYPDQAWHDLAQQPNPVTSTTTYCLVNGAKVAFDENLHDPFWRRKEDAHVKCWKDGEVVTDLELRKGSRSGFLTQSHTKGTRRTTYRDDKQHGEERIFEDGKLKSVASFESGERIWTKELTPDGQLARYSRKLASGHGAISRRPDGKVYELQCAPAVKDDKELRRWCGFEGALATPIYDGTGKVSRVVTWKDGVIQKEAAGDSAYAARSDVAFKDGKKQGEERLHRPDGTLEATFTWDRGVKDGREQLYSDDGKKVVKDTLWKAGQIQVITELYLNGNPKLRESYDSPTQKQQKAFWDTGKVSREGTLVLCEDDRYGYRHRDWCEDGVHRSYFEDGTPESERTFKRGQRQGSARTWFDNGRPASVEEYAADKLTKARHWDRDGKLLSDDEFEADGSRKLRH